MLFSMNDLCLCLLVDGRAVSLWTRGEGVISGGILGLKHIVVTLCRYWWCSLCFCGVVSCRSACVANRNNILCQKVSAL